AFETPVARRSAQRLGGHAGGAIFLRVEAREMLADDFFRRVALDALRARIPAADLAVRIEHEDRVVRHALYQQTELLFGTPQGFGGLHALGKVAGDFRV